MTAARNYSSIAARGTLSAPIIAADVSVTTSTTSGWPTAPFTLIIDKDQVSEEVVTVTAVVGTTLTVTRGQDGTSAVSHSAGATLQHGVSARDFQEAGDHVGNTDIHPASAIAESNPGGNGTSLTSMITSVSAGPTTIVASPAAGKRIVKGILMSASSGATITLAIGATTIFTTTTTQAGIIQVDLLLPIGTTETIAATVTSGPVVFTVSYFDRTDGVMQRLGMTSSSGTGVSLVASGTARKVGQLYVANTSATTATTVAISIGGTAITPALAVPAGTAMTIDMPIAITSAQAITFTGDGATAVTVIASGY
jgi:hypothetical protein